MIHELLLMSLYASVCALGLMVFAKMVLFLRHNPVHYYHPMCLLYFPGIDIQFSSDKREKRHMRMQNRLTQVSLLVGAYALLVSKLV